MERVTGKKDKVEGGIAYVLGIIENKDKIIRGDTRAEERGQLDTTNGQKSDF